MKKKILDKVFYLTLFIHASVIFYYSFIGLKIDNGIFKYNTMISFKLTLFLHSLIVIVLLFFYFNFIKNEINNNKIYRNFNPYSLNDRKKDFIIMFLLSIISFQVLINARLLNIINTIFLISIISYFLKLYKLSLYLFLIFYPVHIIKYVNIDLSFINNDLIEIIIKCTVFTIYGLYFMKLNSKGKLLDLNRYNIEVRTKDDEVFRPNHLIDNGNDYTIIYNGKRRVIDKYYIESIEYIE